jgi:hypothetical protein
MKTMRPALLLASLICLTFLGGCGNDGAGLKLAPVTGRVTYKNQAIAGATIFFLPDTAKGTQGEMGSAILKPSDGSFAITTNHLKGQRDGVAPGSYRVTLGLDRMPGPELDKFRDLKTTPLTIDVPEEGYSDVIVDLEKGTIVVK